MHFGIFEGQPEYLHPKTSVVGHFGDHKGNPCSNQEGLTGNVNSVTNRNNGFPICIDQETAEKEDSQPNELIFCKFHRHSKI